MRTKEIKKLGSEINGRIAALAKMGNEISHNSEYSFTGGEIKKLIEELGALESDCREFERRAESEIHRYCEENGLRADNAGEYAKGVSAVMPYVQPLSEHEIALISNMVDRLLPDGNHENYTCNSVGLCYNKVQGGKSENGYSFNLSDVFKNLKEKAKDWLTRKVFPPDPMKQNTDKEMTAAFDEITKICHQYQRDGNNRAARDAARPYFIKILSALKNADYSEARIEDLNYSFINDNFDVFYEMLSHTI